MPGDYDDNGDVDIEDYLEPVNLVRRR